MSGPPRLTGLVIGDDPDAWRGVGFAVDGGRCTVGGVTIRLVGAEGPRGVLAWRLEPPPPGAVDSIVHGDAGAPAADGPHPNGVRLVDHVVAATSDLDRTTAALGEIGLEPRRTVAGIRGGRTTVFRFFLVGTCVLELIAPSEPRSDRPARLRGVAFVVEDLEATAAWLGERCGTPHDAVQPGRRIASLRHERTGVSVPIAFLTARAPTVSRGR